MRLRCDRLGAVLVLTVDCPRLDASNVQAFRDQAVDALGPQPQACILDLGRVVGIDSSGIAAITWLMNRLGRARRLELCALRPPVLRVLKITRLDAVFSIRASLAEALAATSAPPQSPSLPYAHRSAS